MRSTAQHHVGAKSGAKPYRTMGLYKGLQPPHQALLISQLWLVVRLEDFLLISGSTVRVRDGPPTITGTSKTAEVPVIVSVLITVLLQPVLLIPVPPSG